MSSGTTSALGLSQWSLSDPFLMEEFNADNRKIDAAVGTVPIVKLGHIETTATAEKIDLDMSEIDWAKYRRVIVVDALVQNGAANIVFSSTVTMNDRAATTDYMCHTASPNYGYGWSNSNCICSSAITNYTDRPSHHLHRTEIYPEFGCGFLSVDMGLSDSHWEYASILRSASGSYTPAPVSTLQKLSYTLVLSSAYTAGSYTAAFLPGCKFDFYGVKK